MYRQSTGASFVSKLAGNETLPAFACLCLTIAYLPVDLITDCRWKTDFRNIKAEGNESGLFMSKIVSKFEH